MEAVVTKDMSINEVLQMDQETAPIFLSYGMHCLGCPFSMSESIEDAGSVHGVDVDALVDALNEYFENK